jgi:thiamine biosynthesis lipoprotein
VKRREFLRALGLSAAGAAGAAVPAGLARAASESARLRTATAAGDLFVERWSWAMGQSVHLQLFAASEAAGFDVAQAALAELRRVERALTLFDDGSDLCELNRAAGRGPRGVGPDLAAVLEAAERFRAQTAGAFDPAVEPLMRAWGFHAHRTGPPSSGELAEAREAVHAAHVQVEGRKAALGSVTTQIDLGGIGVGYGLDRMADVFRRAGIRRAFLDVSGDCLAIGAPPGQSGWLVEIADPTIPGGVRGQTRLRDAALATSANTVSVVRWGRAVRGHVMNPATGYPASALVQATVTAGTGIEADALSTAMLVAPARYPGVTRAWSIDRA